LNAFLIKSVFDSSPQFPSDLDPISYPILILENDKKPPEHNLCDRKMKAIRIPRTLIPKVASQVVMFWNISGMEALAINSTFPMSKSKVQNFELTCRPLAIVEWLSLFAFF
jgi:hypothetical protein